MRMWRTFRSWSTKVQVMIGVVAALVLIGAVAPDAEDDVRSVAATSNAGPIEDELPMAPTTTVVTTTTTLEVSTTTAAPTTTTAAPTTTVAPTTTTIAPSPPPPTTIAPARTALASSCHRSYDPCLPITGDLDCGDIGQTVRVVGPDDYRLDRDGDGSGCE